MKIFRGEGNLLRSAVGIFLAVWCVSVGRTSADESPHRGGTLIFGVSQGEPDSLDCHGAVSTGVMRRLAPFYSTLLKIDPAHYPTVIGDVAQSWSVSPDGLAYTFLLLPNIQFHDGEILSSADVKATYERLKRPPPGVVSTRQAYFQGITNIDTPNSTTLVFHMAHPDSAMLMVFASPWNCIYSSKHLAADPTFPSKRILGTGPFRFVQYVPGSELVGARFENYFRHSHPYLDGFKAISVSGAAEINALVAGQIQTDFNGILPADMARIAASHVAVKVLQTEQPSATFVVFNTARPPFNDARVRRALSMAIDRWQGSRALARITYASEVGGLQRPGSPFAMPAAALEKMPGFGLDMDANRADARRLLTEAGQSGLSVHFMNRHAFTGLGIFLIDQWRRIGVNVTQTTPENPEFFASEGSGNFDMMLYVTQDTADEPSFQFFPFLSHALNPLNMSRSTDHEVDELYMRQAATADGALRKQIVFDLESHLLKEAYMIPIFWNVRYVPMATNVRGYSISPDTLAGQDLADIWLSP
jgi:peptide/nickel transport system substrate-binding protein